MEIKDVKKELVARGAKCHEGLKIKGVKITPEENYTRISIRLDKPVETYKEIDGEFKESTGDLVFVSAFTIASLMRENDDTRFAVDHCLKHVDSFKIILDGATVDVWQEPVTQGQDYINPWSDNPESRDVENTTYYTHLTSIKVTAEAKEQLKELKKYMMGMI